MKLTDDGLEWFLDFQINEDDEFPERMFDLKPEEELKYITEKAKTDKVAKMIIEERNAALLNRDDGNNGNIIELNFDDRTNKRTNDNPIMKVFNNVKTIRNNYKRNKLIEECKLKIKNFDDEVKALKGKKLQAAFKQKLGEFELLLKHEEFYIIKAFDTDDIQLIKKLDLFCADYKELLQSLKTTHEDIISNEEDYEKNLKDKEAKDIVTYTCFNLKLNRIFTIRFRVKRTKKQDKNWKQSTKPRVRNWTIQGKINSLLTLL